MNTVKLEESFINENTILKVVAGSHAYGTNTPTSDWDERGVFIDDIFRVMLPFEKIEQVQMELDDVLIYELSKFMPLVLVQNPNVLEILWTEKEDVTKLTEEGALLLENRQNFLSLQVKDTYVGYARSQLGRIKGHNKWINNPQPKNQPEQKDFVSVVWNYSNNKSFNKEIPKDNYFAINLSDNHFALFNNDNQLFPNWIDKRGVINPIQKEKILEITSQNLQPSLIVKFNKKLYEDNHDNWKSYWNWKKNRNEKRAELEIHYGYDTKHAMHLIRLLKSGCEILEHNKVFVKREDKDFLLSIRNGKYSYEEIVKMSEDLSKKVELLAKKSTLRTEPNYDLAKKLMLEIYKKHWGFDFVKNNQMILNTKKYII